MNSVLVIGVFLELIFLSCLVVGIGVISPILFLINYDYDKWVAIIVLIGGIIGTIIIVGLWIGILS
jgi:hypothetical protein